VTQPAGSGGRGHPAARPLLSLSWVTTFGIPPVQHVEAAAAAGFDGVSLRVGGQPETGPPLCEDSAQQVAVRRALQDTGLRLLHTGGLWLDGRRPVAAHERAIACGAELGACMCVAVAPAGRTLQQVRDDCAALCELGARYRLPVALEPVSYLAVRTLEEARARAPQRRRDPCPAGARRRALNRIAS